MAAQAPRGTTTASGAASGCCYKPGQCQKLRRRPVLGDVTGGGSRLASRVDVRPRWHSNGHNISKAWQAAHQQPGVRPSYDSVMICPGVQLGCSGTRSGKHVERFRRLLEGLGGGKRVAEGRGRVKW